MERCVHTPAEFTTKVRRRSSQRSAGRTEEQDVHLGDGHDAHDGGDAPAKGDQAVQGVAGDLAQRTRGAAVHRERGAPGHGGQVQAVQVLQEAPLRPSGGLGNQAREKEGTGRTGQQCSRRTSQLAAARPLAATMFYVRPYERSRLRSRVVGNKRYCMSTKVSGLPCVLNTVTINCPERGSGLLANRCQRDAASYSHSHKCRMIDSLNNQL